MAVIRKRRSPRRLIHVDSSVRTVPAVPMNALVVQYDANPVLPSSLATRTARVDHPRFAMPSVRIRSNCGCARESSAEPSGSSKGSLLVALYPPSTVAALPSSLPGTAQTRVSPTSIASPALATSALDQPAATHSTAERPAAASCSSVNPAPSRLACARARLAARTPTRREPTCACAGEYFAENPQISIPYCAGGTKMFVFAVLMDKSGLTKRQSGIVVVNKVEHQLPMFIITFDNPSAMPPGMPGGSSMLQRFAGMSYAQMRQMMGGGPPPIIWRICA